MDGHATISNDLVASYAADATREVAGVRGHGRMADVDLEAVDVVVDGIGPVD